MTPYEITSDGRLRYRFDRHRGQWRAWQSLARIVAVIAGTQSGKTVFGPLWLHREMQQRGPGDYLVATPTFPLLELKALPAFRGLFEDVLCLGRYRSSPVRRFDLSRFGQEMLWGDSGKDYETSVYFGHASDPESLESMTIKAGWLDECGQKKFKLASWQAIQRRVSIWMGRLLLTTTPYFLNWLKTQIWDQRKSDPDIEVINFRSIDNPAFPKEEYERARRLLPEWKFRMFFLGLFTKPAGLIYGSFNEDVHKIRPFSVPREWPRALGLDFGGVNTVGLFYANRPGSDKWVLYREYKAADRTAAGHVAALAQGEPVGSDGAWLRPLCFGGSWSESQWRREFRAAGLDVRPPVIKDVEVGIDRVYGAHQEDRIEVFESCTGYLDEKATYSRVLDENDEPTEEIEDKEKFHHMDAERYPWTFLGRPEAEQRRAKSAQG